MKKGVIFDMDGTLFDTERLYAVTWGVTAEHMGYEPHPDFPRAVAGSSGEGQREIIRRFYPGVDAQAFQDYCYARIAELVAGGPPDKPGVREILAFFRERGVKIAVASSSGHEVIETDIRNAGIESFFDAVVSGEDVEHGKPAPDIFLLAAKLLGCAPEDCYVFEDSLNGVRAGIAAGCATIMIPDMVPPAEDFRESCAGIYPSFFEAIDALKAESDA